ncbi:MAG: LacI family transcriptional regulator [Bifidobacteriaceae bacterium]|jgi:LacI family transcriptional regulator|nr:LacI family transcriptional regulator [Bifidobacteriaceae bacterium]
MANGGQGNGKMATLADVARLAGVSVPTASKALRGRGQLRQETRDRIRAAADQLSFTPNPLARGLLAARSGIVGLVTHDLEGRFSIPILMGAEDAFGLDRLSVMLSDARGDAIREQRQLEALVAQRVDGIIVVGARSDERASLGRSLPVPLVYAYAHSADPTDCSIIPNSYQSGRLAVDHLIACGRSRIGVITGDPGYGASQERVRGALDALHDSGLAMVGDQALFGAWNQDWGRAAAAALLDRHPDLDGLVCGSDQIALGVLDVLGERGVTVPRDISVIGHDNWEVLSAFSRPPLTSIDMNLEELGRRAAARLVEAMNGTPAEGREVIAPRLALRKSTMPTAV